MSRQARFSIYFAIAVLGVHFLLGVCFVLDVVGTSLPAAEIITVPAIYLGIVGVAVVLLAKALWRDRKRS